MSNIKMRAFKKEDFYGFAGAENFPNGSKPIISEGHIRCDRSLGSGLIIASDKDGITVVNDRMYGWDIRKKFKNPEEARNWIHHCLKQPLSELQLKELGFDVI